MKLSDGPKGVQRLLETPGVHQGLGLGDLEADGLGVLQFVEDGAVELRREQVRAAWVQTLGDVLLLEDLEQGLQARVQLALSLLGMEQDHGVEVDDAPVVQTQLTEAPRGQQGR